MLNERFGVFVYNRLLDIETEREWSHVLYKNDMHYEGHMYISSLNQLIIETNTQRKEMALVCW
jgi:hypothetical protein